MFDKRAVTSVAIHDLLARRWSGRAYDPDRRVPADQLMALLEAARWAPSCFGDQPWRFIVCDRSTDPASWQTALDCLVAGNQSWARHAPVLMLAIADSLFNANSRPNRWAQYDTGAASMSLCIEATARGMMVHQMGGFDADRARRSFAIPERYVPMAMMTLGYQLPELGIPEDMREREHGQRQRRPLGELFYMGTWSRAVDA
ncbi:MAG: nitroreductase family protein [Gammaproteobacteria bacterium]|nr:nitroreductase family protein [Gammaproteobacteria bacterium]